MSLIKGRRLLFCVLMLLVISVVLGVFSFYPVLGTDNSTHTIIDDSFNLTGQTIYHQGIGSFHGNENITLTIKGNSSYPLNFELITYNGQQYNVSGRTFNYSFTAGADYYEAVFTTDPITHNHIDSNQVTLQVIVQSPNISYPFSWIATPAKTLFIISWAALMLIILKPELHSSLQLPVKVSASTPNLDIKRRRQLQTVIILSLIFWSALLAINTYPLGTFEDWYTDGARHPYTATLFTKVGFSVFDTPLGQLSSLDSSFYKFVTWPEMPHLYPVGSILLFLPFGVLLEAGISMAVVLKLEVALFLLVSHVCLYYFLKWFWNKNVNSVLKLMSIYIFYIVLVMYSANGQFDALAFFFTLFGVAMFLDKRYDAFLLLVAVATTIKYQAGIFLAPLVLIGLLRLFRQSKPSAIIKSKIILAAFGLVVIDLFTAFLSMPYLTNARPELIMNGVNAFNPHGQIPWGLQFFTVLLFLSVTLVFAVHLINRSRIIALFAIFSLLPCLTMPYFQPWYLPLFFVYLLISQQKRSIEVTIVWLIFAAIVLSFGGLSYNPLFILDRIRGVLTFPPLSVFT